MTKIILTDCDGVLMDWERTFSEWMIDNGYTINQEYATSYNMAKKYSITEDEKTKIIKHFNESSRIGWLPPLRDAIKYVKKLHEEHGYVFHTITSLSRSPLNSVLISHQHNKMLDNKRDTIPRFTNWEKLYNSVLVEK